MKQAVIIGAGLSGMYAAWLLEQHGIHDYVVLEARSRLGGRLLSETVGLQRFDLGATWYWPQMQPEVDALLRQLGLRSFAQHEDGMMLFEPSASAAPQPFAAGPQSPAALRIEGGMDSLVQALAARIPSSRLLLNHRVQRIVQAGGYEVEIEAAGPDGIYRVTAAHAFLALPPRLAAAGIDFVPPLPEPLSHAWSACPTWMAPHAKYLAVYPRPFWRDLGLSGDARSHAGPMVELHDASPVEGQGALFGFVGVPAAARGQVGAEALKRLCRAQLVRLFGAQAAAPSADWLMDWSREEFTATPADGAAPGGHVSAPPVPRSGSWQGRITGIASEWSQQFPGYVAGAIDAADDGIGRWQGAQQRSTPPAGH